jgi:TonB-dependent starch-binding outer membrane protein SusC
MKKLLMSLMGLFFVSLQFLQAQTKEVSGKITDASSGNPLAGVTIKTKGAATNTVSGTDGTFTLQVQEKVKALIVSYVGFKDQEVAITASSLSVSLAPADKSLSEVVVVGYGTKIKRDITGSVAKVGAKELANTPVTSFENAIQGRAAGVLVEQQNGKLGQGIKVRIRGSASVTAGNEPLYVLDGIPLITTNLSSNGAQTNPLSDINSNDIESVEILKDASAAAIYGSRGSNGVVLITTKKGKAGKSKIEFSFYTGTQQPTAKREFLNAQQYVEYFRRAAVGGANYDFRTNEAFYTSIGVTAQDLIDDNLSFVERRLRRYSAGNDDYKTFKVNTNWQDQAFQKAPISQYDISLSGANDKTSFYMSGQYFDQAGIIVRNSYKRYSGRINLEHKVKDWLAIGFNLSYAKSANNRVANDNTFSTPIQIVALSPITPLIDPRTKLISGALDTLTGNPNTNFPVYYNPLLSVENAYYKTAVNRTIGSVFGNVDLAKGLSFRTELGLDQLNQTENSYNGPLTVRNSQVALGLGFSGSDQVLNINTNNFFRYTTTVADAHNIEAVAGTSFQDQKSTSNTARGELFPGNAYKLLNSAGSPTEAKSFQTQFSFLSYFARANYKFKDKYLAAISGRYDGSSRFGANNRWGFFPAASVGWILSEENFLKNSKSISFLKLKASYGLTGNAEIGNFASRGLYSANSYANLPGQAPTQLANPDLKWENTTSFDAGLEIGLLKNRISIEADYYTRNTTDLLLNTQVPSTTGFSTQLKNVGALTNKGVELTINTENVITKDFRWSTSINFAKNVNKITNLNGQELGIGNINRGREGQPLGVFVAREFAGADPANGDALYIKNTVDASGKIDRSTTNDYNEAQDVVIGNPNPDFIYGINNNFSYKGLDLSILLQGVQGNQIFNGGGQYMSASGSNGFDNQTTDQLQAWSKPGDITNVPEARLFLNNGTNNSSRYISDGSYLRVKAITLGYNLPKEVLSKLKIERARFYVRTQNLFTITKYKGWDPEVNADYVNVNSSTTSNINTTNNIAQGQDFYSAPQLKTLVFGVIIGL